jgi:hypothetical protein
MAQTEQDWPILDSSSHITNTGRMIEEMEIKMRGLLQEVWSPISHLTSVMFNPEIRFTLGRRAILCTICGVLRT